VSWPSNQNRFDGHFYPGRNAGESNAKREKCLPQLAEIGATQPVDAAGVYLSYDEYGQPLLMLLGLPFLLLL
jgi:hypothetical protein